MLYPQDKRDLLESVIAQAQQRKLGIWSQGASRVSAADHKRIHREQELPKESPFAFPASQTFRNLSNSPAIAYGVRGGSNDKGVKLLGKNGPTQKKTTMLETAVTGLELLG